MKITATLFSAALALGGIACGNLDNALDCNEICDRYKACYDSSYNEDACYDRCRANSDDSDFRREVEICDACISGRDCSAAAFNCATECNGVVP